MKANGKAKWGSWAVGNVKPPGFTIDGKFKLCTPNQNPHNIFELAGEFARFPPKQNHKEEEEMFWKGTIVGSE
jgi:hypothetical protein